MKMTNFPKVCLESNWAFLFDLEKWAPNFIEGQYWWAKEEAIHSYGDDPPETPAWAEAERSGNPLLTTLPLRPFQVGHLMGVIDGVGVYAILREPHVDSEGNVGPRFYGFALVDPAALETGLAAPDGIAHPGEQTCWPLYTIRIRESRLRQEAAKAWEHIEKAARRRAQQLGLAPSKEV